MNLEELQALFATGEGQLLEFKRSGTAPLSREIFAFANSLGGRILKNSGAINRAVKELLEKKFIEYTLPDKPNSRM